MPLEGMYHVTEERRFIQVSHRKNGTTRELILSMIIECYVCDNENLQHMR